MKWTHDMLKSNLICRHIVLVSHVHYFYYYYYRYTKVIKLKNTMTDLVYKKYGDVVWMVEIHRKGSDISKYVVSTLWYVITCIFRSYICMNTSGRKKKQFHGDSGRVILHVFHKPYGICCTFLTHPNPMIHGH